MYIFNVNDFKWTLVSKRIAFLRVYTVACFNMKTVFPNPVTDERRVRDAKRDLSPPDLP